MYAKPRIRNVILVMCTLILAVIVATTCGCLQNTSQKLPEDSPQDVHSNENGPIQAHYSAGEITRLSTAAEQEANASLNAIAALPPGGRTIDRTLLAFERTMADYGDAIGPLILMGYVYPDREIAAEGIACEESTSLFLTATYSRRDLYDALKTAIPRTAEESRLYDITIRDFERNGLKLPDERLAGVRAMKDELSGLETRFSANLNNDNTTLEFWEQELTGVPASSIATFRKTEDGMLLVTTKYPDYLAVMTYADRGETRRTMYVAYNNRQEEENTRLLEEAIVLRQRIAKELGYETWADYKIEGRMAKDTGTVMEFLNSLKEPLLAKNQAEIAELLKEKQELDPSATAVDPWDILYLQEKHIKQRYSYDKEQVKEYFPVDGVLSGMFAIAGTLYGIQMKEMENAPVWSPEVRLFSVSNSTDGSTIGYLYLDPYPREGKYGHFAAANVMQGRMKDGSYSPPVVVIMANFQAPEKGKPSLMTPDEMWTLFHETGHALHMILTRAPYASLSGTSVEWDFVETPSQAFEEWVWDPEILESLSGHYTNTSIRIPEDLRDHVIDSQNFGKGYLFTRILANSLVDMRFHTAVGPVNVTDVSHRTCEEVTGVAPLPETHPPASFGHVMGGYDAGYYGYLWSKVYALEIVDVFRREGMTDPDTGMKYRQAILERGNMEDGNVLLQNFLGREPGFEALYRHIGINMSQGDGGAISL